ncbi:MAG: MlaD family protein [bacterium]
MASRNRNFTWQVGLFATISIIIVVIGFTFLENIAFSKSGYRVTAVFNNISGLVVGADVQVYGVTRGKVEKIRVTPEAVEVEFSLDEDIQLKEDAYAALYQVSLISNDKYIDVFPGTTATEFDLSEKLPTLPTHNFDAGQITRAVNQFENLVDEVKLGLDTTAGELFKEGTELIVKSQLAVDSLTMILSEMRRPMRSAVNNFNTLAYKLMETGEDVEPLIWKFDTTLTKLDSALTLLIIIEDSIVQGKGTLGKLVMDDAVYNELHATLIAYRELAEDLKANPRKYINLEIF